MTDHTITKHTDEHHPSFEQLSALLEVFPDTFSFKDGAGRWQILNESAKRLFHLEGIPWKGKTDMELAELHPDFREIHEACIADDEKAWQTKRLIVVEEKMVREDGQQATYEARKLPLFKENGERAGIMSISRDITEQKEAEERIKQMVFYDDLTPLPNRRFLEIQMEQAMARAERLDRLLAVCMLDLDNFKPVNDTYGHAAGDEVLVALGKRLPEALRKSDFVARLGGDEFVLLLEHLNNLDDLANIMKKIEDTISAPIPLSSGKSAQVGASMGVAIYPFVDADAGDKLLRLADQALYESKENKADRERSWVLFGEEIHKAQRNPAQQLLDAGGLEVWYQPILDSRTRRVVGIEALARLRDTDGTLWMPEKFLPQLQDVDLFDLSKKVLTQALADMPTVDAQDCRLWVSVNLDPVSVSEACITCLREMIAQESVDPSRISLEILEGSNFLEQQAALEHLLEMKALGVHLALDDIGSAYSSLLRLKDLPIGEIKLDQGFIRILEDRPQDLHFVGAIQELAAGLGVDLVVEGVETEDILDAVTVMGAYLLQGYAIAKPMPLAELQTFLGRTLPHQQHPNSLLGLYAKQLVHHNALKKAILQDPKLVDYMTLVDATSCSVHADIQRLVADGDGLLDKLHQEYHRAIAVMDALLIASPDSDDWSEVERAREALEQAIIKIYCKHKTEDGHSVCETENPTDPIATDHF
ncbi:EAL domain-containing protein [Acidithiobacillus thiooxidans]|uniref:EAL domain-containing protein n=1 Tax=Acidithiobacillus thiooxidans TaxID=930 RepID=UPI0028590CBB|nr:EAL domain-containing protein [Acidithiobacillus thiooxidans]MDR7927137.1 EAL domain-containing protein [Acidithiobacillus thiooxidans]